MNGESKKLYVERVNEEFALFPHNSIKIVCISITVVRTDVMNNVLTADRANRCVVM